MFTADDLATKMKPGDCVISLLSGNSFRWAWARGGLHRTHALAETWAGGSNPPTSFVCDMKCPFPAGKSYLGNARSSATTPRAATHYAERSKKTAFNGKLAGSYRKAAERMHLKYEDYLFCPLVVDAYDQLGSVFHALVWGLARESAACALAVDFYSKGAARRARASQAALYNDLSVQLQRSIAAMFIASAGKCMDAWSKPAAAQPPPPPVAPPAPPPLPTAGGAAPLPAHIPPLPGTAEWYALQLAAAAAAANAPPPAPPLCRGSPARRRRRAGPRCRSRRARPHAWAGRRRLQGEEPLLCLRDGGLPQGQSVMPCRGQAPELAGACGGGARGHAGGQSSCSWNRHACCRGSRPALARRRAWRGATAVAAGGGSCWAPGRGRERRGFWVATGVAVRRGPWAIVRRPWGGRPAPGSSTWCARLQAQTQLGGCEPARRPRRLKAPRPRQEVAG